MARIRLRIGLRLLLLLMALCCVLVACFRAFVDLQRENDRMRLTELQDRQRFLQANSGTPSAPQAKLADVSAELDEVRGRLGLDGK